MREAGLGRGRSWAVMQLQQQAQPIPQRSLELRQPSQINLNWGKEPVLCTFHINQPLDGPLGKGPRLGGGGSLLKYNTRGRDSAENHHEATFQAWDSCWRGDLEGTPEWKLPMWGAMYWGESEYHSWMWGQGLQILFTLVSATSMTWVHWSQKGWAAMRQTETMQQSGALCAEIMGKGKALSLIEHLICANFMLISFCHTGDSVNTGWWEWNVSVINTI